MSRVGKFSVGFISGHLTVVAQHEASSRFYWCNCECGRERVLVAQRVLDRGFTTRAWQASCGSECKLRPNSRNDLSDSDLKLLRHAEQMLAAKIARNAPIEY